MSLSRKIPALLLGGLGLLMALWLGLVGRTVAGLAAGGMAERMAIQARELRRVLEEAQETAMAKAELLAGWPDLARWTAEGRTEELLEHVGPVFEGQNRRYGVDQVNFFSSAGVAVLRAQEPGLRGDNVLAHRPMIAGALRSGEPTSAVVVAHTGPSVSAVAPLRWEGRLAGLVEVGIDPGRLVREINQYTGAEGALLFDRAVLQERAPEVARRLGAHQVLGRYQCLECTDWETLGAVLGPELRGTVREPLTFASQQEDGRYTVALLPLEDYAGAPIGLFVSIQRADVVRNRVAQLMVPMLAGAATAAILGSALVLGVSNGLLVRPVRDLAGRLEDLAAGGQPPPAGPLAARGDEVGTLARAYEKLREKGG